MPWFPDFVAAVELARRQTRTAGLADPVAQYFTALEEGDARAARKGVARSGRHLHRGLGRSKVTGSCGDSCAGTGFGWGSVTRDRVGGLDLFR